MRIVFFTLSFTLFHVFQLIGQNGIPLSLGSPFITNYTDDIYLQAGKNWDIGQGNDGKMYFANNYGLVQFDGYNWERIGQPENQSEIRSFKIHDNRIYIGGTSEIGFFQRDENGSINYINLTPLIPDSTFTFNDVRSIASFKNEIFFLTDNGMMRYENGKINILGKNIPFREYTTGIDEVVFAANNYGLYRFSKDSLIHITPQLLLRETQIEFLLAIKPQTYLIGTDKRGVLKYEKGELGIWNTRNQNLFIQDHLLHATILNKSFLLFGSLHEGLIKTDYRGNIIQIYNEKDGLLDHNILSLYKDNSGNIWTAVDGSVSYLELNNPFTIINKKNGLRGEIYCILPFESRLYVGTSRGLYVAPWDENLASIEFQLIPNTTGQCWDLFAHQNNVLLAHHNGVFQIQGAKAQYIGGAGAWNFAPLPQNPDILISGNYTGASVIQRKGNSYIYLHQIEGFQETAKELFIQADEIWIEHGYQGIYKLQLSEDYKSFTSIQLYNDRSGLPSSLYNNLITVDKGLFFGTQAGVYQYNAALDQMEPSPFFIDILGESTLIRKLIQTPNGNYFTIKGYDRTEDIAWIEVLEDGSHSIKNKPFQKLRGQLIPAFESLYFKDEKRMFIGSKQGLLIYDQVFGNLSSKNHQSYISRVSLPLVDSTLYLGHHEIFTNSPKTIHTGINDVVQFEFTTSFFEAIPYTTYSTYLEGFDKNWQDWDISNQRSFVDLPAGAYTFWVKSKNIYDVEGQAASFSFQIIPSTPGLASWSSTFMFWSLGLLSIGLIIWTLVRYRSVLSLQAQMNAQTNKIQQLKGKKENWKKEKELINQKLSFALLQNEVHASLIQKIEELSERRSNTTDYKAAVAQYQNRIKEIQVQFNAHKSMETDDFLSKIKKKYPDLSPRELRLCSYLKLNVSSKEIAEYLGISIRGVESLRYRVRKKLGLKTGEDLTEFILAF